MVSRSRKRRHESYAPTKNRRGTGGRHPCDRWPPTVGTQLLNARTMRWQKVPICMRPGREGGRENNNNKNQQQPWSPAPGRAYHNYFIVFTCGRHTRYVAARIPTRRNNRLLVTKQGLSAGRPFSISHPPVMAPNAMIFLSFLLSYD